MGHAMLRTWFRHGGSYLASSFLPADVPLQRCLTKLRLLISARKGGMAHQGTTVRTGRSSCLCIPKMSLIAP